MSTPSFSNRLLRWFDQHGRKHLPWQVETTPYRVWVSEIMLQQTQVSTVIAYYLRFMDTFPTLQDLAAAPLDTVLGLWSGLGYYARARNLHKAAQQIVQNHNGVFPLDFQSVTDLPGIGRSTAGAILAFSSAQRHPILDGNVKRILCRHEAFAMPPSTKEGHEQLWAIADRYTPTTRVAAYTQAVMDLGATLCTRTKPRCQECPIQATCKAYKLNRVLDFPIKIVKPPKPIQERVFLMVQSPKGILLYQRPSTGIWGGLWSLPEWSDLSTLTPIKKYCESLLQKPLRLKPISLLSLSPMQHHFTHYQLVIKPLVFKVQSLKKTLLFNEHPTQWCTPGNLNELGLPAPIKKLLRQQFSEGALSCRELCTA